jgi:signal transduction histidine kinase
MIMNGIEAMGTVTDRSRELVIRSRRHEPDQALIAVQDSGTGIDPDNMDRLFNAFFTTKHGVVDLPLDYRGPWGGDVGFTH